MQNISSSKPIALMDAKPRASHRRRSGIRCNYIAPYEGLGSVGLNATASMMPAHHQRERNTIHNTAPSKAIAS